jgi:hypothetical protein
MKDEAGLKGGSGCVRDTSPKRMASRAHPNYEMLPRETALPDTSVPLLCPVPVNG